MLISPEKRETYTRRLGDEGFSFLFRNFLHVSYLVKEHQRDVVLVLPNIYTEAAHRHAAAPANVSVAISTTASEAAEAGGAGNVPFLIYIKSPTAASPMVSG